MIVLLHGRGHITEYNDSVLTPGRGYITEYNDSVLTPSYNRSGLTPWQKSMIVGLLHGRGLINGWLSRVMVLVVEVAIGEVRRRREGIRERVNYGSGV